MKNKLIAILAIAAIAAACNNPTRNAEAEGKQDDLGAARSFIQAALKGNYTEAKKFMLKDSINDQWMSIAEHQTMDSHTKQGLYDASVNIHNRQVINDSTTVIIYSNTFKNDKDTLKVLKQSSGEWLVDLKYLFNHDNDTINVPRKPGIDTVIK
jgi:type II secretory pathway pseudopilin PulG